MRRRNKKVLTSPEGYRAFCCKAPQWQVFQGQHTGIRGYSFEYDNNYRLINAFYGEGPSLSNNVGRYSVLNITYDDNGNILTLNRNGRQSQVNEPEQYGPIDQLQYDYSGNQLVSVSDGVSGITNQDNFIDRVNLPQEYSYDSMGNMITDDNKQISYVTYNFLNLPEVVTFQNNSRIEYTYDASGIKLRKKVFNSSGTLICNEEYIGGIIYQNNVLASMAISDGRVVYTSGGNAKYRYFIKDQAGSIRVVFEEGANGLASLVEENHYYPFGMNMSGLSTGDSRFQFGGKEYQEDLGLLWYDFSARNYDAQLGRWFNIDPMAEKYLSYSPYDYCLNNPISFIDPNGMEVIETDYGVTFTGDDMRALWDYIVSTHPSSIHIRTNYTCIKNGEDLGGGGGSIALAFGYEGGINVGNANAAFMRSFGQLINYKAIGIAFPQTTANRRGVGNPGGFVPLGPFVETDGPFKKVESYKSFLGLFRSEKYEADLDDGDAIRFFRDIKEARAWQTGGPIATFIPIEYVYSVVIGSFALLGEKQISNIEKTYDEQGLKQGIIVTLYTSSGLYEGITETYSIFLNSNLTLIGKISFVYGNNY